MAEPRLNLVVLRCLDVERAAVFYRRLGLHFEQHQHGAGPEHYAAESAGTVFELYLLFEGSPSASGARVGFSVDSVDDALARLLIDHPNALVSSAKDSPWGRRAVVQDPDGHRVELIQSS